MDGDVVGPTCGTVGDEAGRPEVVDVFDGRGGFLGEDVRKRW